MATLTFIAAGTANSSSISVPVSAQVGDLAVIWQYSISVSSIPISVIPSGFASVVDVGSNSVGGTFGYRGIISWKVLQVADIGAPLPGMSGTILNDKIIEIWRLSESIALVTTSAFNSELTENNPSQQTVLSGAGEAPLIVLGSAAGVTAASFSVETPAFSSTTTAADGFFIVGKTIYNSSPIDQVVDMNDLGNGNRLS